MLCPRSLVAALLSTIFLASGAIAEEKILLDTVVAVVDDEAITLQDVSKAVDMDISPEGLKESKEVKAAIQVLVNRKLIELEAETEKVSVEDEEVRRQFEALAERNKLSVSEFEKALIAEGQSRSRLEEEIRFQLLQTRVVGSKVKSKAVVSDEEVKEFLKSSGQDAADTQEAAPEGKGQVGLNFILVPTKNGDTAAARNVAEKATKALKSGVPLADVVRANGLEQTSRQGIIMSISDMQPELREAVSELSEPGILGPIELAAGFQVVEVTALPGFKGGVQALSMEEARKELEGLKFQAEVKKYLAQNIQSKHYVEILVK